MFLGLADSRLQNFAGGIFIQLPRAKKDFVFLKRIDYYYRGVPDIPMSVLCFHLYLYRGEVIEKADKSWHSPRSFVLYILPSLESLSGKIGCRGSGFKGDEPKNP